MSSRRSRISVKPNFARKSAGNSSKKTEEGEKSTDIDTEKAAVLKNHDEVTLAKTSSPQKKTVKGHEEKNNSVQTGSSGIEISV